MKVKATKLGYYEHKRRREGAEFFLIPIEDKDGNIIPPEKQFSPNWMEIVDAEAKEEIAPKRRKKA